MTVFAISGLCYEDVLYDSTGGCWEDIINALNQEAIKRNFNVNPIDKEQLVSGIQQWWFGEYQPTQAAMETNRTRISERLENM
ncbi:MAG: hypothetical protein ACRC6V_02075 [Bacteroidales bacterium]